MNKLNYQDYLPPPRNNPLINNSPEFLIREAYKALRRVILLNTFETRAEHFEDLILEQTDMNNIPNQNDYINEIQDLKEKLENIQSPMIKGFFSIHIKKLGGRLSFAKIDQKNEEKFIRGKTRKLKFSKKIYSGKIAKFTGKN